MNPHRTRVAPCGDPSGTEWRAVCDDCGWAGPARSFPADAQGDLVVHCRVAFEELREDLKLLTERARSARTVDDKAHARLGAER